MQLWPANEKRVRGELRRGLVEVGVRHDDHRRRVAELEADALARRALARCLQPTSPEPVNVISAHALVARRGRRRSPTTEPDDDVEPARRQARLLLELGEQQRRERRLATPA